VKDNILYNLLWTAWDEAEQIATPIVEPESSSILGAMDTLGSDDEDEDGDNSGFWEWRKRRRQDPNSGSENDLEEQESADVSPRPRKGRNRSPGKENNIDKTGSKRKRQTASFRQARSSGENDEICLSMDLKKYNLKKIAEAGGCGRVTFVFERENKSKILDETGSRTSSRK
jgi:hypothetical protein